MALAQPEEETSTWGFCPWRRLAARAFEISRECLLSGLQDSGFKVPRLPLGPIHGRIRPDSLCDEDEAADSLWSGSQGKEAP